MSRVLLLGCSGCGRTTVGGLLAERLGWPFLDDDAVLERTAGTDTASLFRRDGRTGLLAAQASALNLLLAIPGPVVGTLAAGVDLDEVGQARVRGAGHVVWLRAKTATLVRRVGRGQERPWLGTDPAATLAASVADRHPVFASVAHQVVDVDVLPIGHVVRAVLDGLPPELRSRSGRSE